ncbi:unnamed protein product [Symbiodinium sp. CCMP2592]|nr:unnamed protein product [Symbiodinium sp. CCMP2592]
MTREMAMIRLYLRQLLYLGTLLSVGDATMDMLEETMAALEGEAEGRHRGGPGQPACSEPPARNRGLDYVAMAKLRIEDVGESDGPDGVNQHQAMADLGHIERDLAAATDVLQGLARKQGGYQVNNVFEGIAQVRHAIAAARTAAHQGDFDWMSESWGATLKLLLQPAMDFQEETLLLNFAHAADVAALEAGALEEPPPRQGDHRQQAQQVLRDLRGVAPFLTTGGDQLRGCLAMVTGALEAPVTVDTQTTEEGEASQSLFGQLGGQPMSEQPWKPPLDIEQWPGSIPSSGTEPPEQGPTQPDDSQWGPSDDDLLAAMDAYERQVEEEAREQAMLDAVGGAGSPEEDQGGQPGAPPLARADSHRRRRLHAALYDEDGGFWHPGD